MSGYGPPPAAPPQSSSGRRGAPEPHLLGYAAGLLGLLSFVWGFLDWYTNQGQGTSGYSIVGGGAGAAIGLSLTAGLIAAGVAFEGRSLPLAPAAIAVSAFLVTLGVIIGKSPSGEPVGAGIGLILELITTILQALLLGYLYLSASGRLPKPRPRNASPAGWPAPGGPSQYGQFAPPTGQFPPAQPPGGYAPAPAQHAGGQQPSGPQPGQQQPGQQQQSVGQQFGGQPPGYHPPYDPAQQQEHQSGQQPFQPPAYGHQPYQPPQYQQQPYASQEHPAETTQFPPYGADPASGQWSAPPPAAETWSPTQSYAPPAEQGRSDDASDESRENRDGDSFPHSSG